jgi:hypothetical protein
MPTSHYFPQRYGGNKSEQRLIQSLADEQIKLFGSDVYYLPRKILQEQALNDVIFSEYTESILIEMLLQNVQGFDANSEFISKFGLKITDEVTFIVSRYRWEQEQSKLNLNAQGRPNEGDLIYLPITKSLYEIKFVDRRTPFYQLGEIFFYTITAEIYELGDDNIDTGIREIDEIEEMLAQEMILNLYAGGSLDFLVGERVTAQISGVEAVVSEWNVNTRTLKVIDRTGLFGENEGISGQTSGAQWIVDTYSTFDDTNSLTDQNKYIEDNADDFLIFNEENPFGEYGNIPGSF